MYRGLRVPTELEPGWNTSEKARWWRTGVDMAVNTTVVRAPERYAVRRRQRESDLGRNRPGKVG